MGLLQKRFLQQGDHFLLLAMAAFILGCFLAGLVEVEVYHRIQTRVIPP